MAKHEKAINWGGCEDDGYAAAEIQRLRAENETLKARIKDIEQLLEKSVNSFNKLKNIAEKAIESKDRTIERLENKILALVNDYV